jgi:hypothetical protein
MNMKQWVGFCQQQLVSDKRYLEAEHAEWIQLWIRLKTEAQGIGWSSFDFYKTNASIMNLRPEGLVVDSWIRCCTTAFRTHHPVSPSFRPVFSLTVDPYAFHISA